MGPLVAECGCPIHHKSQGAVTGAGFSQCIDEQAAVGGGVVADAVQERLSDGGAEEHSGIAGLDGAVRGVDGKLEDIVSVNGIEGLAVATPVWSAGPGG